MDLDLKAIAPRADGKHSPLLHKYLRREKARRGVFQRTTDPISGDLTAPGVWSPSSIVIGTEDDKGWLFGNSLLEIIHGRARHSWAIPIGLNCYRVITDEFWAEYIRDGRCAIVRAAAEIGRNIK